MSEWRQEAKTEDREKQQEMKKQAYQELMTALFGGEDSASTAEGGSRARDGNGYPHAASGPGV